MKTATLAATLALATLATVPTLAGCGDDHAAEGVDVEGCEHTKEGPAQAITATTNAGVSTPEVDDDHKRYDVTLADVTGGKGGFVAFASSEETDYVFFLDADVPIAFLASGGNEVTPTASATSSPECSEVKGRHVVRLPVGTYDLRLGPTTATTVGIVVEPDHEHAGE